MYCVPSFMTSLGFYARLFPTYYMLSNASLTASVWLMCALMFERYRALCRPLSVQAQQMSVARVHKILTAVVLVAVIFSLPRLFELALFEYEGEVYVRQTFLVENRFYMIGYRIVGGLLFYSLFPYIGLFTMSTRISFAMHAASKERQRLALGSQKSRRESSDSELILLAVMAKFLLSRLMPTALDVAEHIVSAKEFLNSPTATICVDISNLLVVISSATNFFVYCAFSRSFRHVVCPRFTCLGRAVHGKGRQRRRISLKRTVSSNSSACSSKLCDMNNSTRICAPLLAADFPLRRTEILI
ncbi:FMRFamide receptor [Toxocara canis]|uniref:FMRFamide receptor n=1 Tax=Toxocara canis TaxID=6265 RepID=A0A0B2VB58_TOXCA|nr:FMRFamide receptor [Toxocara canis]KHN78723.1 FMRFamide receptor [Toxocara canis]